MSDVTEMLKAMKEGREKEAENLLPTIYEELRRIAVSKMASEAEGHTLQPTALVNEAWIRMFGGTDLHIECRAHFFSVAAEAMRRILVESARRRQSLKRGAGVRPVELEDVQLLQSLASEEMLTIDEALDLLAAADPIAADLVKLKYFVGMTMKETAQALGISLRSAERIWKYARAWLRRKISEGHG
ncbi:MAG: sigma-70 family RNA polymerase sigma factor [Verrucomicrobia bacterium]|nr:sigma-70 family RNA polymerase sigma factor [Verrucomicrobiota bacterium]